MREPPAPAPEPGALEPDPGDSTLPLLDAGKVASLLNVPERWVRDATREGRVPFVPLGRYRRYRLDRVLAWLDEQEQIPGRPR